MGIQRASAEITVALSYGKLQDILDQLVASANEQDASIRLLREDAVKSGQREAAHGAAIAEMKAQVADAATRAAQAQQAAERSAAVAAAQVEVAAAQAQHAQQQLAEQLDQRVGPLQQRLRGAEGKQLEMERSLAAAQGALAEQGAQLRRLREALGVSHGDVSEELQEELAREAPTSLAQRLSGLEAKVTALSSLEPSVSGLRAAADEATAVLGHHEEELKRLSEAAQVTGDSGLEAAGGAGGQSIAEEGVAEAPRSRRPSGALDDRLAESLARDMQRTSEELRRQADETGAVGQRLDSELARIRADLAELAKCLHDLLDRGASATAKCLSCHTSRKQFEHPLVTGSDGKVYPRNPGSHTAPPLGRGFAGSDKLCGDAYAAGSPASSARRARQRPKSAVGPRRISHSATDGML